MASVIAGASTLLRTLLAPAGRPAAGAEDEVLGLGRLGPCAVGGELVSQPSADLDLSDSGVGLCPANTDAPGGEADVAPAQGQMLPDAQRRGALYNRCGHHPRTRRDEPNLD